MQTKEIALAALIVISLISALTYFLVSDDETFTDNERIILVFNYFREKKPD